MQLRQPSQTTARLAQENGSVPRPHVDQVEVANKVDERQLRRTLDKLNKRAQGGSSFIGELELQGSFR